MSRLLACLSLASLAFAVPAQSQTVTGPRLIVSADGGVAVFTRFLETRVGDGEQELRAATGPSFGLAASYRISPETTIRLSTSAVTTDIETFDDSGTNSEALDSESLADLWMTSIGLEGLRTFAVGGGAVTPYAIIGVHVVVWSLDDVGGAITAGDDSEVLIRGGVISGGGIEIQATPALVATLEARAETAGNPFSGKTAYQWADGGDAFDEPGTVGMVRLRVSIGYSF